ncbi:MAG: hypothetical protein LBS72_00030 [Oscillospiraceae bacterium]|jgi:phi13 family phage major tail protein|nr:hypothetical protein [Oscillospiraceae bacterium]
MPNETREGFIGLEGIVLVPLTENSATQYVATGTPINVPWAKKLSVKKTGNEANAYADNRIYFKIKNNTGADITINIMEAPLQLLQDLGMGLINTETGALEVKLNPPQKNYSLRFVTDTVDKNPYAHKLRVFTPTDVSWGDFQTTEEGITVNEVVITGAASAPLYSGAEWYAIFRRADGADGQAAYDAFVSGAESIPAQASA